MFGLLSGIAASVLAYFIFGHVRQRVTIWRDPWATIDTTGYQICQSLFAIGMGCMVWIWAGTGTSGKNSSSGKKDFMFSAITEEFGIIFAVALILICLNNLILMMNIASRCKTLFLQACSSSRIGCDLWVSGIFDRGRCYEDDTYDRCNYAVCQLWR